MEEEREEPCSAKPDLRAAAVKGAWKGLRNTVGALQGGQEEQGSLGRAGKLGRWLEVEASYSTPNDPGLLYAGGIPRSHLNFHLPSPRAVSPGEVRLRVQSHRKHLLSKCPHSRTGATPSPHTSMAPQVHKALSHCLPVPPERP